MKITCRACGRTFTRPPQRGRPPVKCPKCRGEKPAQKASERLTRTRRPASPERQPVSESQGLAASIQAARACLAWVRKQDGWSGRGYQRVSQGVAGVEAARAGHSIRMEWQNGRPITDKAAFKRAIANVGPVIRKRTRTASQPPARQNGNHRLDNFERTREAVQELAAWCREKDWQTEGGWVRVGKTGGIGKLTAKRGKQAITIRFENGQPLTSVAGFRKQIANV